MSRAGRKRTRSSLETEETSTVRPKRKRMQEAVEMKSDNYAREWARFITAITEAQGNGKLPNAEKFWVTTRNGEKLPPVDEAVLIEVSQWYLDNTSLAQLKGVKSAVNHHFQKLGSAKPWTGFSRLMLKYEHLQFEDICTKAEADISAGKKPKLKRMEFSEAAVWKLIEYGDEADISADRLGKISLVDVSVLGGLRAASLKIKDQSKIRINGDGWLVVTVSRIKARDLVEEDIMIPPGPKDDPDHPRNRMFATIKRAIDQQCFFIPSGSVTLASKRITEVLQDEIFQDFDMPKGRCFSSHSGRKTLASMCAGLGDMQKAAAMSWGGWGSEAAMQPYINRHYKATGLSAQLFDWLAPRFRLST